MGHRTGYRRHWRLETLICSDRRSSSAALQAGRRNRRGRDRSWNPELTRQLIDVCEVIDRDAEVGAATIRGCEGSFGSGAGRRNSHSGADQAEDQTYRDTAEIEGSCHRYGQSQDSAVAAVRGAVSSGLNRSLASHRGVDVDGALLIGGFARTGLRPSGGFFVMAGQSKSPNRRRRNPALWQVDGPVKSGRGRYRVSSLPWWRRQTARRLPRTAARDPELSRATIAVECTALALLAIPRSARYSMDRSARV
jgi:hypothetical protein